MAADRKVSPREVPCPTCGVLAGVPCRDGLGSEGYHSARIKLAANTIPVGEGHREKAEQLMVDLLKLHDLEPPDGPNHEKWVQDMADGTREYHEELFAAVWERDPGAVR